MQFGNSFENKITLVTTEISFNYFGSWPVVFWSFLALLTAGACHGQDKAQRNENDKMDFFISTGSFGSGHTPQALFLLAL